MHQAQGSAGQTRDHHHSERRQPRPVGQGELPVFPFTFTLSKVMVSVLVFRSQTRRMIHFFCSFAESNPRLWPSTDPIPGIG